MPLQDSYFSPGKQPGAMATQQDTVVSPEQEEVGSHDPAGDVTAVEVVQINNATAGTRDAGETMNCSPVNSVCLVHNIPHNVIEL